MTVRIGANPIIWSNDDLPEIGGWITLDACLTQAQAAGYEGMELGHKFPRDPAVLKPILAAHSMALVGGWYSTFLLERDAEAEFAAAADHRALLKAMGTDIFIVAECSRTIHGDRTRSLSLRPVMNDQEWAVLTARLEKLAGLLHADGLRLVYHHHMGTVIQTGPEIDRLMTSTGDGVGLLLDTGHATWAGDDPVRLARAYRNRIRHVHCKDVREKIRLLSSDGDWSFLNSVLAGIYTVPGDGTVDYVSVFRTLAPWSGWVVVEAEQDASIADPEHYARLGYNNLKALLREGGLMP